MRTYYYDYFYYFTMSRVYNILLAVIQTLNISREVV